MNVLFKLWLSLLVGIENWCYGYLLGWDVQLHVRNIQVFKAGKSFNCIVVYVFCCILQTLPSELTLLLQYPVLMIGSNCHHTYH